MRGPWFNVAFAIVAAIAIVAIQYFVSQTSQIAPIPYSQFEQLLQAYRFFAGKVRGQ